MRRVIDIHGIGDDVLLTGECAAHVRLIKKPRVFVADVALRRTAWQWNRVNGTRAADVAEQSARVRIAAVGTCLRHAVADEYDVVFLAGVGHRA